MPVKAIACLGLWNEVWFLLCFAQRFFFVLDCFRLSIFGAAVDVVGVSDFAEELALSGLNL